MTTGRAVEPPWPSILWDVAPVLALVIVGIVTSDPERGRIVTTQLLVVAPLFVRRLWPTAVFVLVGVLAAATAMRLADAVDPGGCRGARELHDGRPQPRSDPCRGPRARRCRVDQRGAADPGRLRLSGRRLPVRRGRPGVAARRHRPPAPARGDRPVGGRRAGPARRRGARSRRRRRGAADDGPRAP